MRRGLGAGLLALIVTGLAQAAGAPRLLDPHTGDTVVLEPGPPALHLVFFATWCPSCVDELPRLGEIEERWSPEGYRLVLVAVRTRQVAERLTGFAQEHAPPGRLLFDAEGQAEARWQAKQLPTHVVLDAQGREVARSTALDARIEAALADLMGRRRGGTAAR